MDLFDYIVTVLRETFVYSRKRTRNKYEGDRFEEWVMAHSNIQKHPKVKEEGAYWRLLEWRGDKYISGWFPLSSLAPDLLLESVRTETEPGKKRIVAVECKYSNNKPHIYLKRECVRNYEHFCRERNPGPDALYYLFGFQWHGNAPKEVYLIPSTAIYDYDKEKDRVKFLHGPKDLGETPWYVKYKVSLNPEKGMKYIQYRSSQL